MKKIGKLMDLLNEKERMRERMPLAYRRLDHDPVIDI